IIAEKVVQSVNGLNILWDSLVEPTGQTYLAELDPVEKLITLNEKRRRVFEETAGLRNTVVAHEGGHWNLHVDPGVEAQLPLSGLDQPHEYLYRHTDPQGNPREWQAHRFMSYLLLPHDLLTEAITGVDLLQWPNLYYLREQFDVTITVLRIRLEQLGLLFVGTDRQLYRSASDYSGSAPCVLHKRLID
ncbi:MAG: ImmA/IrrE family metallo-endopeptidase, partial [Candidatus Marsarchaeota archaeon]|nr:ImmA/IrrE family metallo-endopeptidase [Candidatus Marsarchaeota archaeon]